MRRREQGETVADDSQSVLRRAASRFALISGVCVVGVVAAAYVLSTALAEHEALRDATERAEGMARGIAAPLLDEGVREGRAASRRRLGDVLQGRISEGGVSQIVVWNADGRILWSSDEEHVGETFTLSQDARGALAARSSVAHLPAAIADHADELYAAGEHVEVYVGAEGADGLPFLFEAYMPAGRIAVDRAALLPRLLAVSLGSVFLLLVLLVPLALDLARRVDEAQRVRAAALHRSVLSWRHQRRLLAQELHDGVIQDVGALGLGLSLLDDPTLDEAAAADVLTRLQESAHHAEVALRSLVLDLAPRELEQRGLADAVVDLVRQRSRHGLEVTLAYDKDAVFPDGSGILAFRTVREGLRNVVKHVGAGTVLVAIRRGTAPRTLEVEVVDDGPVPPPDSALGSGQGLSLLADTIVDAGGSLQLGPAPGGGSRLFAVIPFITSEAGRP